VGKPPCSLSRMQMTECDAVCSITDVVLEMQQADVQRIREESRKKLGWWRQAADHYPHELTTDAVSSNMSCARGRWMQSEARHTAHLGASESVLLP
jgi:hypothetical protein